MIDFGIKENCLIQISISHIHNELDYIEQVYNQTSFAYNSPLIESNFSVFNKAVNYPISISNYSAEVKSRVSDLAFAIKRIYFELYQPEIVEHFIKADLDIEKVKNVYIKKLNLGNYKMQCEGRVISYFRNDIDI